MGDINKMIDDRHNLNRHGQELLTELLIKERGSMQSQLSEARAQFKHLSDHHLKTVAALDVARRALPDGSALDLVNTTLSTDSFASINEVKAQAFDDPVIVPSMKAECIGEITFPIIAECGECIDVGADDDCLTCGGEIAYQRQVEVPWDTQKEIFKLMCKYKAESLRQQAKEE